jgi:hypothetical protein
VSCTSSNACTAVGQYTEDINNTSNQVGLAERWNGRRWSIQSVTVPPGATHQAGLESVALDGVSCVSQTACTAVGDAQYVVNVNGVTYVETGAIAEHWDGIRWFAQTLHLANGVGGTQLYGVSCTSSTVCTAVGYQSVADRVTALIERSSGTLPAATVRVAGATANADGTVSLRVAVSAPGDIDVMETAWLDNVRMNRSAGHCR